MNIVAAAARIDVVVFVVACVVRDPIVNVIQMIVSFEDDTLPHFFVVVSFFLSVPIIR